MIYCKRDGGFMYEEEIFYEEDGGKKYQLGCYTCPHKVYVGFKEWNQFKARLSKAIYERKNKSG